MKSASSSALSLRIRSTIVGLGVIPVPIVMSRRTCVHLVAQSAKLWRDLVPPNPNSAGLPHLGRLRVERKQTAGRVPSLRAERLRPPAAAA
jgi:hypothetical protein